MSDSGNQKLYDIRAGEKIFPSLSASIIVKNIKNGKLKPHHEISGAGMKSWRALEDVPELEMFFHPEKAPTVQRTMAAKSVGNDKKLFDIRVLNKVDEGMTVVDIARRIRAGEFNETDFVRVKGTEEWKMAGDHPVFQRYFDLRRSEVRAEGMRAIKKDYGKPFYADLITPLKYIGTKNYLGNLGVILFVLLIPTFVPLPIVSGPITVLTTFYIFSYYFRVINDAGSGGTKFPATMDFSDFVGELIRPGFSFFMTKLFSLIPLFIYLSFGPWNGLPFMIQVPLFWVILSMPWAVLAMPAMSIAALEAGSLMEGGISFLVGDIFVWLGLIFFLLYFPISLLRQSSYGEMWPTVNLPAVFQSILRTPGPYLALIALNLGVDFIGFLVLLLIGFALAGTAVFNAMGSVFNPGSAQLAGALITYLFPMIVKGIEITSNFIKMYFMGRFMFQNAQKMGWD